MSTGVTVADNVAAEFEKFKLSSNKTTFIIYKIDGKHIVEHHRSGEGETFESFLTHLPENECRYGIFKMDFTTNDGRPATKLVFITW